MIKWQIASADNFETLSSFWDKMVDLYGQPIFLKSTFLIQVIRLMKKNKKRVIAIATNGNNFIAGGVFESHKIGFWTTVQPSQLPLGAWIYDPSIGVSELLESLIKSLPKPVITVSITQQEAINFANMNPNDKRIDLIDYIKTAWIDTQGSFDDYWTKRGRNLKQNLSKIQRKLESERNTLSFTESHEKHEILKAIETYARIENEGWKGKAGTAISSGSKQENFYKEIMLRHAEGNNSLTFTLVFDRTPIACALCLLDKNSLIILKTTYSEEFKNLSPGQLMHEKIFRYAFDNPLIHRVEFYGRLMEWHSKWTENSRRIVHVNFYTFPILSMLHKFIRRIRCAQE